MKNLSDEIDYHTIELPWIKVKDRPGSYKIYNQIHQQIYNRIQQQIYNTLLFQISNYEDI